MWRVNSGFQMKGWDCPGVEEGSCWETSGVGLRWMYSDSSPRARRRHSSRRKTLKARIARISACQSWMAMPFASGSLEAGRHFMPVLGKTSDFGTVFHDKSCLRQC